MKNGKRLRIGPNEPEALAEALGRKGGCISAYDCASCQVVGVRSESSSIGRTGRRGA